MTTEQLPDLPQDMPSFLGRFGTDAQCRLFLVRVRWPELTAEDIAKRRKHREMMKLARAKGMGGGLDLRCLPGNWKRGVTDSLFRKMAHLIECRWEMLVKDNPRFERKKPDPGPFWPKYKGMTRVYAAPGETAWRYVPPDVRGGYPGTFPVLKSGLVLTATVDINLLKVELPFEPEFEIVTWTRRARACWREQQRKARESPAPS